MLYFDVCCCVRMGGGWAEVGRVCVLEYVVIEPMSPVVDKYYIG